MSLKQGSMLECLFLILEFIGLVLYSTNVYKTSVMHKAARCLGLKEERNTIKSYRYGDPSLGMSNRNTRKCSVQFDQFSKREHHIGRDKC